MYIYVKLFYPHKFYELKYFPQLFGMGNLIELLNLIIFIFVIQQTKERIIDLTLS